MIEIPFFKGDQRFDEVNEKHSFNEKNIPFKNL